MTPLQFEKFVQEYYTDLGYQVTATPATNDYGIVLFAVKLNEKIGVQVKMYGSGMRKINRACIMELYGAMAYFDCTSAKVATNGDFLPDAVKVANKLGIEIVRLQSGLQQSKKQTTGQVNFEYI